MRANPRDTTAIIADFYRFLEDRNWDAFSALLTKDVRYDLPQTRERVIGRGAYLRLNQEYPSDWHLAVRRLYDDGDCSGERGGVAWLDVSIGGEVMDNLAFFTLDDQGRVTSIIDFWPESYDPPPGREHLSERY